MACPVDDEVQNPGFVRYLCPEHFDAVKLHIEELVGELVLVAETPWALDLCFMCEVPWNPDATCLACGCALHPQWPAVYCSNKCAIKDSQ